VIKAITNVDGDLLIPQILSVHCILFIVPGVVVKKKKKLHKIVSVFKDNAQGSLL